MSNRGIGRARMFVGAFLLLAAVITWGTAAMLSPHGSSVAEGTEHVRSTMVTFLRNSALGTLALTAVAAWALFPARRPKKPARDWALIAVIAVLAATSVYQLVWLRMALQT